MARCRALQEHGEAGSSINAALAAPSPCFVLSSGRKLINHNREFYDFVSAAGRARFAQGRFIGLLTLDAEVPKLIDLLASKPGNALTCGYTLRIDARLLRGKARVALIAQNDAKLLVGYIFGFGGQRQTAAAGRLSALRTFALLPSATTRPLSRMIIRSTSSSILWRWVVMSNV